MIAPAQEQDLRAVNQALEIVAKLERERKSVIDSFGGRIDEYTLVHLIQDSGNGVVFEATKADDDRRFVVKVMPQIALSHGRRFLKFQREIEIGSRLNLPNIAPVIDSGDVDGRPYLVTEFVAGRPPTEHANFENFSLRDRVTLAIKIIRAVSSAHQLGVIHRDLKPSNIMVDNAGEPYILDFGLAKALDDQLGLENMNRATMIHEVPGTLAYLSPEQAMGLPVATVLGDVFALGVILFELLTGTLPYDVSGDFNSACWNIVHAPRRPLKTATLHPLGFPEPGEFDRDLQAVVYKALASDPGERYQSADAFAEDLERYLSGDIVQARLGQRKYVVRRFVRIYKKRLIAGAACLALLVATTSISVMQWRRAERERNNAREFASIAHGALDQIVTTIDGELESLAGGTALREQLLDDMDEKLSALRELSDRDAELSSLSVQLAEKEGDIARNRGDTVRAVARYQDAIDSIDTNTNPVLAASLHRKAGRADPSHFDHFDSALLLARTAVANNMTNAHEELARILVEFGRANYLNGNHLDARAQLDEALNLIDAHHDNPILRARALEWKGDVLMRLGNSMGASNCYGSCIDLRRSLIAARESDVRLQYASMTALGKLSTALTRRRDFAQAVIHANEAAESADQLCRMDPGNACYQRDFVSMYTRFAGTLRKAGRLESAVQYSTEAIQRACEQLATRPSDAEMKRRLGFAYLERCRDHLGNNSHQDALSDSLSSLELRAQLATEFENNMDHNDELARAHEFVAHCMTKLNRSDKAGPHRTAVKSIREHLFKSQPNVPSRLKELVSAEINLASWHIGRNTAQDDDESQHLLLRALDRVQEVGASADHANSIEIITRKLNRINLRKQIRIRGEVHSLPAQSLQARPRLREEPQSDSPL